QPVKQEQCGAPAAVMLRGIGSGANQGEINPPPMLNCAMVAPLHTWVEKVLQPAPRESFRAPIARLHTASGFYCCSRNGSTTHSDKLSEPDLANAIDIGGCAMADGRTIDVAQFWGPTLRDQRAAEQLLAVRAQEIKREAGKNDGAPARGDGPH